MVKCAINVMEKMRDYLFETTVCKDTKNSSTSGDYCGAMDCSKYTTQNCHFRGTGMPPNVSNICEHKQTVSAISSINNHILYKKK